MDFGKENGGNWEHKSDKIDANCSGGPSWEPTSMKNRLKTEVEMGRQLGIDFSSILMDFGTQAGKHNRAKFAQKRHRKNGEKQKGNTMIQRPHPDWVWSPGEVL